MHYKKVYKRTNKNEYLIISHFQEQNHFPKIKNYKIENNNKYIIVMPLYEYNEINYNGNVAYIQNYIKSLLENVKVMHENGYVHGDIKPKNFLYK